jgi:hypothetical protein
MIVKPEQLTQGERNRIEAERQQRTPDEWRALPKKLCACGQTYYREHRQQLMCRDCMQGDGSTPFSFYPHDSVWRPATCELCPPSYGWCAVCNRCQRHCECGE